MDIAQYLWVLWVALILVFVIIEMMSLEFTFLMLAIGSLGGLVTELFGGAWWLQIIVAFVLAVLLLFTLKPPLLRALRRGGDPARSNVDALIGMGGRVVMTVTVTGGQARLANGETWTARLSPGIVSAPGLLAPELPPGESVLVTAIEGATAVVVPAERSQP